MESEMKNKKRSAQYIVLNDLSTHYILIENAVEMPVSKGFCVAIRTS